MGLDLRLLPIDGDAAPVVYSHMLLSCFRRRDLFEAIRKVQDEHGVVVPDNFYTFTGDTEDNEGEPGYGTTQFDPYGEEVHYILAKYLKPFQTHEGATDNPINRAVWAFICALPDDFKIALYWH